MRSLLVLIATLFLSVGITFSQSEPQGPIQPRVPVKPSKPAQSQPQTAPSQSPGQSEDQQPSGTEGQASSKESKGDTSAPLGDAQEHPESDSADVGEMHVWNPHKADKNVEVGDYHMRRKNYPAAESRYREALQYQNNNAPAMYGLAQALEKEKKPQEAVQYYAMYLKTLPHGPQAENAKAALHRLGGALPDNAGPVAESKH